MPATTPTYAFPYPLSSESPDGSANLQALANKIDQVLNTSIYAPLDSRIHTLETAPPPTVPGLQWNHDGLSGAPLTLDGNWDVVHSTGPLASGYWLLVSHTEIDTDGNYGPAQVVVRIRNISTGVTVASKGVGCRTEIVIGGGQSIWFYSTNVSLRAVVPGGYSYQLQCWTDSPGNARILNKTKFGGNEVGCTRLTWIKIA